MAKDLIICCLPFVFYRSRGATAVERGASQSHPHPLPPEPNTHSGPVTYELRDALLPTAHVTAQKEPGRTSVSVEPTHPEPNLSQALPIEDDQDQFGNPSVTVRRHAPPLNAVHNADTVLAEAPEHWTRETESEQPEPFYQPQFTLGPLDIPSSSPNYRQLRESEAPLQLNMAPRADNSLGHADEHSEIWQQRLRQRHPLPQAERPSSNHFGPSFDELQGALDDEQAHEDWLGAQPIPVQNPIPSVQPAAAALRAITSPTSKAEKRNLTPVPSRFDPEATKKHRRRRAISMSYLAEAPRIEALFDSDPTRRDSHGHPGAVAQNEAQIQLPTYEQYQPLYPIPHNTTMKVFPSTITPIAPALAHNPRTQTHHRRARSSISGIHYLNTNRAVAVHNPNLHLHPTVLPNTITGATISGGRPSYSSSIRNRNRNENTNTRMNPNIHPHNYPSSNTHTKPNPAITTNPIPRLPSIDLIALPTSLSPMTRTELLHRLNADYDSVLEPFREEVEGEDGPTTAAVATPAPAPAVIVTPAYSALPIWENSDDETGAGQGRKFVKIRENEWRNRVRRMC